jgi:hypothetical protein
VNRFTGSQESNHIIVEKIHLVFVGGPAEELDPLVASVVVWLPSSVGRMYMTPAPYLDDIGEVRSFMFA